MTSQPDPAERADWEAVLRNIDTERRRLDEAEALADELLGGGDPVMAADQASPSTVHSDFDALSRDNDALRVARGWTDVDLMSALGPDEIARYEVWEATLRLPWTHADIAAVGFAGLVGVLASVFDDQLDAAVLDGLGRLKELPLLKGWESAGKGLPIDYTGPDFGGPDHRFRSAGHDLGRPIAALKQIIDGQFRGVTWADGTRTLFETAPGAYNGHAVGEALVLWMKHLAADFVTTKSLPMPFSTFLYEMPDHQLRKFSHDLYGGVHRGAEQHAGLNMRSGLLTPAISLITTEVIIRSFVQGRAWHATRSLSLSAPEKRVQMEMLLAGHSFTAAGSISNAVIMGFVGEGPIAVRHVNVPVLMRLGKLALEARKAAKERARLAPPAWHELAYRGDAFTRVEAEELERLLTLAA